MARRAALVTTYMSQPPPSMPTNCSATASRRRPALCTVSSASPHSWLAVGRYYELLAAYSVIWHGCPDPSYRPRRPPARATRRTWRSACGHAILFDNLGHNNVDDPAGGSGYNLPVAAAPTDADHLLRVTPLPGPALRSLAPSPSSLTRRRSPARCSDPLSCPTREGSPPPPTLPLEAR